MINMEITAFKNGIAYVNCYPEGKTENVFKLTIDVKKHILISNSLGKMDSYVAHAFRKICNTYALTNSLPEKLSAAWV